MVGAKRQAFDTVDRDGDDSHRMAGGAPCPCDRVNHRELFIGEAAGNELRPCRNTMADRRSRHPESRRAGKRQARSTRRVRADRDADPIDLAFEPQGVERLQPIQGMQSVAHPTVQLENVESFEAEPAQGLLDIVAQAPVGISTSQRWYRRDPHLAGPRAAPWSRRKSCRLSLPSASGRSPPRCVLCLSVCPERS